MCPFRLLALHVFGRISEMTLKNPVFRQNFTKLKSTDNNNENPTVKVAVNVNDVKQLCNYFGR